MNDNISIERFLDSIKVYPEYINCFTFNKHNKENIWIILSDSTCKNSDLIYEKFIENFNEGEFKLMIFDKEVQEEVLEYSI